MNDDMVVWLFARLQSKLFELQQSIVNQQYGLERAPNLHALHSQVNTLLLLSGELGKAIEDADVGDPYGRQAFEQLVKGMGLEQKLARWPARPVEYMDDQVSVLWTVWRASRGLEDVA